MSRWGADRENCWGLGYLVKEQARDTSQRSQLGARQVQIRQKSLGLELKRQSNHRQAYVIRNPPSTWQNLGSQRLLSRLRQFGSTPINSNQPPLLSQHDRPVSSDEGSTACPPAAKWRKACSATRIRCHCWCLYRNCIIRVDRNQRHQGRLPRPAKPYHTPHRRRQGRYAVPAHAWPIRRT